MSDQVICANNSQPRPLMALSHSRLSDFNQCPRKFKLKYIDKAANFQMKQEDKSVHLVRGDNVHKALEAYLVKRRAGEQNIGPSSLDEVERTKPIIERCISVFGINNVHPEAQVSIDCNWQQVSWFDKQSYYRAIMDVICKAANIAIIVDYKTGKFKEYTPDNGFGQLELSSAIALSIFGVEEVRNQYLYVDHAKKIEKIYRQSDKAKLCDHFDAEFEKVNAERTFDPKRNEFCTYCEAIKSQCQFSRKL